MKNELINVREENGNLVVSSREVAEKFGKRHGDVTEKINKTILEMHSTEKSVQYFIPCEYRDSSGKANKEYLLTRDGFSLLVMGFTGKEALKWKLKYIDAFNKMEEQLKQKQPLLPTTYKEALLALVEEVEKNEKLELENKQQKQIIMEYEPKVSYYDTILNAKGTMTITQIAKDYGMTACEMNKKLHELGIQYKQSETWLLYSKYAKFGYTQSKPHMYENKDGERCTKLNTKWTQKGRLFLYEELKKNGVIPLIERDN